MPFAPAITMTRCVPLAFVCTSCWRCQNSRRQVSSSDIGHSWYCWCRSMSCLPDACAMCSMTCMSMSFSNGRAEACMLQSLMPLPGPTTFKQKSAGIAAICITCCTACRYTGPRDTLPVPQSRQCWMNDGASPLPVHASCSTFSAPVSPLLQLEQLLQQSHGGACSECRTHLKDDAKCGEPLTPSNFCSAQLA